MSTRQKHAQTFEFDSQDHRLDVKTLKRYLGTDTGRPFEGTAVSFAVGASSIRPEPGGLRSYFNYYSRSKMLRRSGYLSTSAVSSTH